MSAQKIADSLSKGIGIAPGVALAELAEQLDGVHLSITPDFLPPPKRGTGRRFVAARSAAAVDLVQLISKIWRVVYRTETKEVQPRTDRAQRVAEINREILSY